MELIDIGFGNMVASARILSVLSPDSSPVRRLVQDAKNIGRVIDATCGKKTRSVIFTDSEHIILSSEETEVLSRRFRHEE